MSSDYFYQFVPFNAFDIFEIDVVYSFSKPNSAISPLVNQFPGLYSPDAAIIWGDRDLAAVTILAAKLCRRYYGWRLRVADCFRPVEAQQEMLKYGFDPSLVSIPGSGAHPRGMAIDIVPERKVDGQWQLVDMGVPFDFFALNPALDNPAARHYTKFDVAEHKAMDIYMNRQKLEFAMRRAATLMKLAIWPLDQEWWDFRFLPEKTEKYAPLKESDLPCFMRMMSPCSDTTLQIRNKIYPEFVLRNIEYSLQKVDAALAGGASQTIA